MSASARPFHPHTLPPTSERFGELRSLLQRRPSRQVWEQVCDLLEREWLDDPAEAERLFIPYAEDVLARWPDALRALPTRWTYYLREATFAPLRLIRTMRVPHNPAPSVWEVMRWSRAVPLTILDISMAGFNRLQVAALRILRHTHRVRLIL